MLIISDDIKSCNATYGGFQHLSSDLSLLAANHIRRSFDYLLLSTYYASYLKNRPGFEKLFRKQSDEKWNDAFEIIKYISQRGGSMNFAARSTNDNTEFQLYELQAIAKAVDIEKQLAQQVFDIHEKASLNSRDHHDPGVAEYLQDEFVEKQTELVRKFSGYATDLRSLLDQEDTSLPLYLFDDYLHKQ